LNSNVLTNSAFNRFVLGMDAAKGCNSSKDS
jgi:hypothetical protein